MRRKKRVFLRKILKYFFLHDKIGLLFQERSAYMRKKLTIGILAHVDAGKTTLSEALLYVSGKIRKLGRVDHKNTYLDTDPTERERGITVFSKQARFSYGDCDFILLDTPGHADFSAEMERSRAISRNREAKACAPFPPKSRRGRACREV